MAEITAPGLRGTVFTGRNWPSMGRPSASLEAIAGTQSWPVWQAVTTPELAAPQDQVDGVALFVEITVYDKRASTTFSGRPMPGMAAPSMRYGFSTVGATKTFYVGSRDVITASSHTPPDEPVPGAIVDSLNFRAISFEGVEPAATGPSEQSKGSLRVSDPNDALAHWCNRRYAWDGWPVIVRRGRVENRRPVNDPSTWPVVARLITSGLTWDGAGKMIGLRDLGGLLLRAPLLRTFRGTGGEEGDAAMAGKPVPRALGRGFYCAPPQTHAELLIYRLNDGRILRAPDVFDGGSRLGDEVYPDYPTFAEMAAATLVPGNVVTCLAEGWFRLGGRPQFVVSAYCNGGDARDGLYVEKRAAIARRLAMANGGYSALSSQLDESSFAAFDAAHPAATGFWFDAADITVGGALAEILAGVLGTWIVGTSGLLAVGWLKEPASSPEIIVDARRIGAGGIRMTTAHTPRWRTIVEWRRNYAPLAPGQHAGNVDLDEDEKRLWESLGSYAEHAQPSTLGAHPFATSVLVRANFAEEADASDEAAREMALLGVPRQRVQAPDLQGDPLYDWHWKTVRLQGVNRFGWTDIDVLCVGTGAGGGSGSVPFEGWF